VPVWFSLVGQVGEEIWVLGTLVAFTGDAVLRTPEFLRRRQIELGLRLVRGVMRLSNRLPMFQRFATAVVDVHVSTELSLARRGRPIAPFRLLRRGGGLYTGRMMNIKGPVDLHKFGLEFSDLRTCESMFRAWFEKKLPILEGMIHTGMIDTSTLVDPPRSALGIMPKDASEDCLIELVHEFVHWLCFKQTSMATLVDMISWRLRFDMICMSELLHLRTGFPRLYEPPLTVEEARQRLEGYRELDGFARDETALEIFTDLATHYGYSIGFYPTVIGPIIEPPTWAIVEPSWIGGDRGRGKLDEYFGDDKGSRSVASDVLDLSVDFLKSGVAHTTEKLIETVNRTLNMPLDKLRLYVRSGNLQGLQTELANRFKEALIDHDIEQATVADRSLTSVLQYSLTDKYEVDGNERDLKIVNILSGLLSREPEVSRYVIRTLSDALLSEQSPGVYRNPTLFMGSIVEGDYVTLRYDPLSGLGAKSEPTMGNISVRFAGKTFNSLEDLVGDNPLSIRTAMLILTYFNSADYPSLLGELGYPLKFLQDGEKAVILYNSLTEELLDMAPKMGLSYPKVEFRSFLSFWLYYLLRMGVYAKYLQGLHGMWVW
jgi:hypothetical protein